MQAFTLRNGWKTATVSEWASTSGRCFVVTLQSRKQRQFKTLEGASKWAERMIAL